MFKGGGVRGVFDSHQTSDLAEYVVDKRTTIEISDYGISATHFDLSPESKEYQLLFKKGRSSAEKKWDFELKSKKKEDTYSRKTFRHNNMLLCLHFLLEEN
ncbi:MAG: hypothetical protein Q7J07_04915 [Pelolinea sp.]|nr:hypothetical protein [Pelolinea sp.]